MLTGSARLCLTILLKQLLGQVGRHQADARAATACSAFDSAPYLMAFVQSS
jgi:hypothetical protein